MHTNLSVFQSFCSQNMYWFCQAKATCKTINILFCVSVLIFTFLTQYSLAHAEQQFVHTSSNFLTAEEQAWLKANPQLTIAIPINFPRSYYGIDGKLQGLGVDYVRLIEKKLGVHFEPIVSDWDTALNRAMNHEVDTILNADKMKYREPYLNFTEVYFASPQTIVALENEAEILDLSELCDRKIAVHKGSSRAKFLQQNYPCIELVEVGDKKEILTAIITNKADAGLDNFDSIMGSLQEMKVRGLKIIYFKYLPPTGFARIGVRKDKPLLASILNKAVLSVSDEEKSRIVTKWLGVAPPPLPKELAPKEAKPPIGLTPSEQDWLKERSVMRLGIDPSWAPVEYFDSEGSLAGITSDNIRILEEKLGIRIEPVKGFSWGEVLQQARQGKIDIISAIAKSEERAEYLLFTKPYLKLPMVIVTRDDAPVIEGIDDLKGKTIAVMENYITHFYLKRDYPEQKLLLCKTLGEALQAVAKGKASAVIENAAAINLAKNELGVTQLTVAATTPYAYELSIGVRKDWPELIPILEKALASITEREKQIIKEKWVNIRFQKLTDWKMVTGIGLVIFLVAGSIVTIILVVNRRLSAEVKKRIQVEKELQATLHEFELLNEELDKRVLERTQELHDAHSALQKSEQKFRTLFNHAPNCIMTISGTDYTIKDFNEKTLEMFRCEAKDLKGKPPYELSPPKQNDGKDSTKKALEEIFPVVLEEQRPLTFEWEHQRCDGEVFDAEVSISILEHKPEIICQAIIRDISERKKLDQEIRLLNHWIEHSDDLFFWVGEDSQILYVNQAVCGALGYTLEEMRAMKVGDFDLEITREAWPGFTQKLREQGSLLFESRLLKKNGQSFPVEITANILEFEGKDHFFAYGRDISTRVKMEGQLSQAQKMEAIGTLAGGIAHDFNNILSAIFGYTELAKTDVGNPENLRNHLDEILYGAIRAKDLVKQILTFSRMSEQEMQPLKMQLVVKEALKLLRSSIPTTIEIKQDINHECEAILADPTQIHQIIMNLCTNAYHAMRESGGILGVSLQPVKIASDVLSDKINLHSGSYLKLEISDTGCGISEVNHARIFEPYFTTKAKGEGTGLGLAVVHGIVHSFGGEITVYSELGKGTTFQVYLPVIKGTKTAPQERDIAPVPTGNERILFVDDDEHLLHALKKILESLGYKVTALTGSNVTLDIFKKTPNDFDLVITDMTMPRMTGADLTREMLAIRPDLPIILCTGFSELIDVQKAKEIGVRDYIVKPISKKDLANVVRKVLDAS